MVNDYRILFTKSGRYQRWSPRARLGMLAKAVNKMKPSVLYDEEEIRKTRKEEWGLQLKENILSLNFWKHTNQRSSRLVVSESDEIDTEMPSHFEVNSESIDLGEFNNFVIEELPAEEHSEDSVETVMLNENQQLVVQTLHSEEVASEIRDIYCVNTMSMTIESEISTHSQELPLMQSQDVIPSNYDNFINIIPLTSTQSQCQESEEINVC